MRILTLFCIALLTACSGMRPDSLGLSDGGLSPCPSSPNCVSSEATDETHQIEAFQLKQIEPAIPAIAAVIQGEARSEIITQDPNYLYAEFTSKLMRYVDDVEFYQPEGEDIVHVRSASRLGYKDFDVNRERIEKIRQQLKTQGLLK